MGRKKGSRNCSSSKKHEDVVDDLPLKHKEDDVSLTSSDIDVVPLKFKRGRSKTVGSQVILVMEEDNATLNSNAIDELRLKHDEDDVPLAAAFSLKQKRGRPKKVAVAVTLVAALNSNGID